MGQGIHPRCSGDHCGHPYGQFRIADCDVRHQVDAEEDSLSVCCATCDHGTAANFTAGAGRCWDGEHWGHFVSDEGIAADIIVILLERTVVSGAKLDGLCATQRTPASKTND